MVGTRAAEHTQTTAENSKSLAQLVPHEGHVFLDRAAPDGTQVLTHDLLLKRWTLPQHGQPWDLVFEKGFGVLVSGETEDVLFLEEWLPEQLYEMEDGELMVVETITEDGSASAKKWSLSARRREYEVRNLKASPDGEVEFDFEVYTVTSPRGAGHLFWNLFCL